MALRQSKQKRARAIAHDLDLAISLEWAVLVLVVAWLVFQLAARGSLGAQFSKSFTFAELDSEPVIVESLNYHGYQRPGNFPKALLRGQVGDLVAQL